MALIYSDVKTFITENKNCMILLSGLEYLISQNDFPKVLKLLQHIELPPDARTTAMAALARTFNENVDKANAVMFSYLDYAVVGQRL